MPKLTLEDISLSLAINGLSRSSKAEDQLIAEDLRTQRKELVSRTAEYFLSMKGKDVCRNCMFDAAMSALLNMTLPDNPTDTDIAEQEMINRAYIVQVAMKRHVPDTGPVETPEQLH